MKRCPFTLGFIVSTVVGVVCGAALPLWAQEFRERIQDRPEKTQLGTPKVEVPLDLSADQPIVAVMIHGQGPFHLLLDTAAGSTVLDDEVVKAAGLKVSGKTKPAETYLASAGIADVVRIDSLALGDAMFTGFSAIAIDLDKVFGGKRHRDGTLALPVFTNCLLTFDYPGKRLVLQEGELLAADGKSILDFKEANGAPVIPLLFGDVSVDITIDSAAPGACVLAALLKRQIELGYKPGVPTPGRGLMSDMEPRLASIKDTVRLGRHELVELPVDFRKGGSNIGHKVLQHFAVTLDQKNHRVRFAREGDDPIRLSPPPRLGIELARRGRTLKVVSVYPDSPVAKSVIDMGTEILSIDGRSVNRYDDDSIRSILRESEFVVFTVDRGGFPLLVPVRARED